MRWISLNCLALLCCLCSPTFSNAGEISPILLASQNGVQLWSQPLDAPRIGMSAASIYFRTENPRSQMRTIDNLQINNVRQVWTDIGGRTYPIISHSGRRCDWIRDVCEVDSSLSFTHWNGSEDSKFTETNDKSYGDLGFEPLPTTAKHIGGLGSFSMASPQNAFELNPTNWLEIASLVIQQQPPQTTISIGVGVANLGGNDSTRRVFFDSIRVTFVPETSQTLWRILAVFILLLLCTRRAPCPSNLGSSPRNAKSCSTA